MPGQWTLAVTAATVQTAVLSIPVRMVFNNSVGGVLWGGGGTYPMGHVEAVAVAVIDGTNVAQNPTVNATLYCLSNPTVSPVPVAFTDDGQGGDYQAGDSIFGALLIFPNAGDFVLQVQLSGTASTGPYQRNLTTEFNIEALVATVTGAYLERVVIGGPI